MPSRHDRALQGWQVVAVVAVILAIIGAGGTAAISILGRTSDYAEFHWLVLSPWRRHTQILAILACIAIIAVSWWTTRDYRSSRLRSAVIAARTGATLSALVLFAQPALELRDVARDPNHVAVLIDTSKSMGVREPAYEMTRLAKTLAYLEGASATLSSWKKNHHIDYFRFDSEIARIEEQKLHKTKAQGAHSRVRNALESVRKSYDERSLAGVILISDGLATDSLADGAGDGADLEFLSDLGARVHTVQAGTAKIRDISVDSVAADEFAFVRTATHIDVVIRASGFERRQIAVDLSSEGKPLRRQWIEVGGDSETTRTSFEVTPTRVGKFAYRISVPVADDEVSTSNNERSFVLRVVRDKFRVLHVAGQPTWDVRALRGILKRNPNVDLISFFILRTQNDLPMASQREMSLIPFPTRELFEDELPSFDLVIFQNFGFMPYGLAPFLDDIRQYVENGGGFVMLGGPLSFSAGGYANTPLASVLPLKVFPRLEAVPFEASPYSAILTEAGVHHPIARLRNQLDDNKKRWKSLPKLVGLNHVLGIEKDAVPIAVHPTRKTPDGSKAPVIVVREVGQGRVLAVATDSLWHWGFVAAADGNGDGRDFEEFWSNATRWLIRDPDLQHLQISSDRVHYRPSEEPTIISRLRGLDYQPLADREVKLQLIRVGDDDTKASALTSPSTDRTGSAVTTTGRLAPGTYRISGSATVGGRVERSSDVFLVENSSTEVERVSANDDTLRRIAEATGGTFSSVDLPLSSGLQFARPHVTRVLRSKDVEIWSGPWMLIIVLGFLALEWGLRQRAGYR